MLSDLKSACRQLARSPGFTAAAVLTLALGIGFSASSFSVTNALLLRDLPYPEAGRLVRIFRTSRQSISLPHAPANLLDIRDAATSFSASAIYNPDNYTLGEPGQPAEHVTGMGATAGFLDVLRLQPALGRGFAPGDDQPGGPAVALLSHRAWMRRYGADPGVLGRTIRLNSQPYTIVGVLPAEFDASVVWGPVEFIVPITLSPAVRARRTGAWMQCVARLKPGVSAAQAQTELATLAARLDREYPKENGTDGLRVIALHESNITGATRALTWLMPGLALAMLLIACANLAGLQVARAFNRRREYAVRAALGGSRRQLMLPLVLESGVLAAAGGALGLLVARWSNDVLASMLRVSGLPLATISLDGRVVAFVLGVTAVSGLACGVAPAWLASRATAAAALRESSRASTPSRGQQRVKRALMVAQLALALTLSGVATSFGLGSRAFLRRPVGWTPGGLFFGSIVLPESRYADLNVQREFHRALLTRLAALPGVERATLAGTLPIYALDIMFRTGGLVAEGQPLPEPGREPTVETGLVSSDFFAALRIPLRQGTAFPETLKADDPPVVVVNQTLADRFWPGGNPLGRRVRFTAGGPWLEVIGVVGDVNMLIRPDTPETRLQLYRPLVQAPTRYVSIALRAAVPPETLTPAVRQAVASLDPDLAVARAGSLVALTDSYLSYLNPVILNLGISAGMGLLIAGVGLFAIISQLIAQRTRDIGVRIALGARRLDILGMVLGEGVRLLGIGIAAGLPGYVVINTVIHRTMPEVPLPGSWLLAANVAVLATAMLLACYLPARRATRIDPVEALRAE
jgi:putative ABC transport system permease protein